MGNLTVTVKILLNLFFEDILKIYYYYIYKSIINLKTVNSQQPHLSLEVALLHLVANRHIMKIAGVDHQD